MKQIDLDDLPPRIAEILSALEAGEELILVRSGSLVARLRASPTPSAAAPLADLPPEEQMAEVLDHFNAMIHDEF